MEWLRNWVMGIAGSIVFGTVCEMMIPDGNVKKYVRVVLGIFLVTAVAGPLAALRGSEPPELPLPVSRARAYAQHQEMDELQRRQVVGIYTAALEEKLASAAALCGENVAVTRLKAKVAEDGEHFGEIQSVDVVLTAPAGKVQQTEEELRERFAREYRIPKEGIRVKVTAEKGENGHGSEEF